MNQKKCMMCGAHLEEKLAPCMEDHDGGCVVIVRNVPALVCTQYGETYYTPAVLKRLDEILAAVKSSLSEVTIVNFHTPRDPLAAAQTVSY